MSTEPSMTDAGDDLGTPLCLGCLDPIEGSAHFCAGCGMPLTMYATSAPLESVWAFGYLIQRLLTRRPTTAIVVGTVVLVLPAFIGTGFGGSGAPVVVDGVEGLGLVAALAVQALYLVLLVRVVRAAFRRAGASGDQKRRSS